MTEDFDPSRCTFDGYGSSDAARDWYGRDQVVGNRPGKFHVQRRIDGSVLVRLEPSEFVVSPMHAVTMAKTLLKEAGVEVVMADAGQTVIRPPNGRVVR